MTAAASQALAGVLQRQGSHAVGLVPIQASDERRGFAQLLLCSKGFLQDRRARDAICQNAIA